MMKRTFLFSLLALLPVLANAYSDKVEINGLYFDAFDSYGEATCRFTAQYTNDGMKSLYTGDIVIPETVEHNGKTYTVRILGANVFYNATVNTVRIPKTIRAIEQQGSASLRTIVCAVEDPDILFDDAQFSGYDHIFGILDQYILKGTKLADCIGGALHNNCRLIVPTASQSKYEANGWGDVCKGGIIGGTVIEANDKYIKYGDETPTLTWKCYSSDDDIQGTPSLTCDAYNLSPVGSYPIVVSMNTLQSSDNITLTNGTLTIQKAPLTVTAKSYTIKRGDPLPTFEATYSGFKNSQNYNALTTLPSISCSATSSSELGEFDIVVSGGSATNYSFTYVKGKLTIIEADPLTVTANNYTINYGDPLPTFGYTCSGGTLEGTPSISCTATISSPVGTYPITISKGSVTSYNVTYIDGTLTINKAPLTVTAKSYTIKQGDPLPTFEATYSGFKNSQSASVLTTQPTFSCSATSASAPGAYDIIVSGAAASNYSFTYVKGTLSITEADPVTVTANNYTINYGDPLPTFGYTSSGAILEGTPSISCTATISSPVGTYPITIAKGSITNYNVTYEDGTLTINKAPVTVTAKSYAIKQGDPLPTFEATYSGFKNSQSASVLTTQPTFSCSAISASAPGAYDIIVSGAAASNYSFTYLKGTLTITEADPVTVTANNYTINYGDPLPTFGYTSSGATLEGMPSISCTATISSPVGTYPITIAKGSITNYNVTYVDGTLTINKAPVTVTAKSYTIKQGNPLPTFEATYSGFKNDETASVLTTQPTFNCSATSESAIGSYDIIVSGAAATNYSFTYEKGTLTIEENSNIVFADKAVKSICVRNWDTDGDGELSKDEAAVVTSLGTVFRSKYFTSFNELQYFTGLTSIGEGAFRNCGLTSVTIPNSVTSIGKESFLQCERLTSITIPNSVTNIGENAFCDCNALTTITIPNSVTSIGKWAFKSCSGLTSIAIPNSVTSIGFGAFEWCSGLISITIPNSVTSIGEQAFCDCNALTTITIPNSVTSIGACVFYNCSGLTSITIPNSVTSIGRGAFQSCIGLTSITIPYGVTSIDDYTFWGCSGLTSITIHNCITSIGVNAFRDCSSLTSISIPSSMTGIGSNAFYGCSSLVDVYCFAKKVTNDSEGDGFFCNSTAFSNSNPENIILHVPYGTSEAYRAIEPWSQFKDVVEMEDPRDEQTLALTAIPAMTYGDADYSLPQKTNENLTLTWSIDNDAVVSVSGNTLSIVGAGTATVTATQAGDDDYKPFSREFTVTVNKAMLTITANDCSKQEDEDNPELTVSYNGFKYDDDATALTTLPTVTTTATKDSPVGTYPITVSGAASDNYTFTYVNGTLTIEEKPACAKPTVSLVNGQIQFSCETEDVEYHYTISYPDAQNGVTSNNVNLANTCVVRVYATRDGYGDSEVTTAEFVISGGSDNNGDMNGDKKVTITDAVMILDKILTTP